MSFSRTRHRCSAALLLPILTAAACGGPGTQTRILRLEQAWLAAQEAADSVGLDSLLAPEFTLHEGPPNQPVARDEYLRKLTRPGVPDRLRLIDPRVDVSPDSVLVTSLIRCTVARPDQPETSYVLATVDLWIRDGDRWLAARRTMTSVSD